MHSAIIRNGDPRPRIKKRPVPGTFHAPGAFGPLSQSIFIVILEGVSLTLQMRTLRLRDLELQAIPRGSDGHKVGLWVSLAPPWALPAAPCGALPVWTRTLPGCFPQQSWDRCHFHGLNLRGGQKESLKVPLSPTLVPQGLGPAHLCGHVASSHHLSP